MKTEIATWSNAKAGDTIGRPKPELSYDGCGINGPDEYRTRIATFSNGADKYGPLFAAAPELLEALKSCFAMLTSPKFKLWIDANRQTDDNWAMASVMEMRAKECRTAIARAEGGDK